MKIIGIICEYNPFHLGHLYQINKVKEIYPDSIIIAIFNGCFMQRGELSIINKWDKTKICLENNIDIIIELPFVYATQSADIFAHGALSILNNLKINTLVFGTDIYDIDNLKDLANTQLHDKNYDNLVKEYLNNGINYPTALSKALHTITNIKIDKPNDLLGLSYIKEIIKNNYNITPIAIKRTNDYHGNEINNSIINASLIRKLIDENKDIKEFVPKTTLEYINNIPSKDKYYELLKYQIINNINVLNKFQTVDEGIENRIKKYIYKSNNLDELITNVKTKRYTHNKIKRMFTHILTNFTKEEANNLKINYIKLLGFNNKGKKYLNSIKKNTIPIITKNTNELDNISIIEKRVSNIYSLLIQNNKEYLDNEEKNKPIIK